MILAVPTVIPATTPVAAPTEATDVLPEVHVPPVIGLVSVVLVPEHKEAVPEIVPGVAFTVTVRVATAEPQKLLLTT